MQTRTPPLRNGPILIGDAQYAETNEKSILRFLRILFFELWSILYSKSTENEPILSSN